MSLPVLPLFLTEQTPLQAHIDRMRSVRFGCMLAQLEDRVVLRTRLSEAQNHRCCWCGVRFLDTVGHPFAPSLEHVTPLSEGGADSPENLAVACRRCNTKRGTKPIDTFQAFILSLGWNEGRRAS
jgi:5-methylcytosine-specific restriction endonuclease McrA